MDGNPLEWGSTLITETTGCSLTFSAMRGHSKDRVMYEL